MDLNKNNTLSKEQLPKVDWAYSKKVALPNKTQLFFFDNSPETKSSHKALMILVHGWPTPAYVWRHQFKKISSLERFRVVAPDLRGYGFTDIPNPNEKSQYAQKLVIEDLIQMMDFIGFSQAILIGHDWGGSLVWTAAMLYSEFTAVCGLTTPYYPPNPNKNPQDDFGAPQGKSFGKFDYQAYFQEIGLAESELNQDIERSFKCIVRASSKLNPKEAKITLKQEVNSENVRERGGLLVGFPSSSEIPRSFMHSEEDLAFFVQSFKRQNGFGPSLNWYRTYGINWKWKIEMEEHKKTLNKPALLVTLGGDDLFPLSASKHMESLMPNLKRAFIPNVSHWVQEEEPEKLNEILVSWLNSISQSNL